MIRALMFDLDGTILDTAELMVQSFLHTFTEELGESVSREEVMMHFGKSLDDQFRTMRPSLTPEEVDRLVSAYRTHNHAHHDAMVSLIPGAGDGLRSLSGTSVALAVVTSKRLDMAQHGLELFGLQDLFATIVHHDSTARHKPHPEPLEKALNDLGIRADEAWYIGDSPYDMMAAKSAGCYAVGFCYNTFSPDQLMKAGADSLIYSWPALYTLWQNVFPGKTGKRG